MFSSTASTMHLLLLFLYWQGVNTEATSFPITNGSSQEDGGRRETNTSTTAANLNISRVLIQGKSKDLIEKHEIQKPQNIELLCNITEIPSDSQSITAFWRKDGKEIEKSQQTVPRENKLYILKKTFEIQAVGNYSCVFSYLGKEDQVTFVFKVPEHKEKRDKAIVSYIGDTVVLDCKMEHHYPKAWQWYKINGTEKELINVTLDKYEIELEKQNKSVKLKVKELKEEDSGKYICRAVFEIGSSESVVPLKVLSFSEPLKPFIAIAVEVVVLVAIILLYEKQSQSRKRDPVATENGPQSEQTGKLTQDESSATDGETTTRQRKVEN